MGHNDGFVIWGWHMKQCARLIIEKKKVLYCNSASHCKPWTTNQSQFDESFPQILTDKKWNRHVVKMFNFRRTHILKMGRCLHVHLDYTHQSQRTALFSIFFHLLSKWGAIQHASEYASSEEVQQVQLLSNKSKTKEATEGDIRVRIHHKQRAKTTLIILLQPIYGATARSILSFLFQGGVMFCEVRI